MNDGLTTANCTNVASLLAETSESVLNTPFVNYTKHPYEAIKYMDPVNLCIVIVTYAIGILGNFAALVHLCRQRSYRNKKHSLMLKCLISNDLIALVGMLVTMCIHISNIEFIKNNNQFFCISRVVWRFFGLNSGCIAGCMALERWLALTKPFVYQKHMTRSLLRRILFFFTVVALALCFLPFVGFGSYIDWNTRKCVRYRDATDPLGISYAFIFFTFGITLCTSLVLFNFSVTKVLYRSHASISNILNAHNDSIRRIYPRPNRSVPIAADADSMTGLTNAQLSLPEELRFAKLMTWLSIAFVICWVPQLISILLIQLFPPYKYAPIFYRLADVLMLVHFMLDPFIYVLLRNRNRNNFALFLRDLFKSQKVIIKKNKNNNSSTQNEPLSSDPV